MKFFNHKSLRNACVVSMTAALTFGVASARVQALDDNSKVPVLLYHPKTSAQPCDYQNNDLTAMNDDIQTLKNEGFTIVPLMDVVDWQLGLRSNESMPDKVAAITMDDGHNSDWGGPYPCLPYSARTVLEQHDVHGTSFVIASPKARQAIGPGHDESWWDDANDHPNMDIQNHSMDHDHPTITQKIWDGDVGHYIPAGGNADGDWWGKHKPSRFTNWMSNHVYIQMAGDYIESKIGEFPELFAYPLGPEGSYTQMYIFLPYTQSGDTKAAFCTSIDGTNSYVTKNSYRWCLPRMVKGAQWNTPSEFMTNVINGAQ